MTDMAKFDPPYGRFYLAYAGDEVAGVGCLKKLEEAVGEIQRMYVLHQFRGKGVGRAIVDQLIARRPGGWLPTAQTRKPRILDCSPRTVQIGRLS